MSGSFAKYVLSNILLTIKSQCLQMKYRFCSSEHVIPIMLLSLKFLLLFIVIRGKYPWSKWLPLPVCKPFPVDDSFSCLMITCLEEGRKDSGNSQHAGDSHNSLSVGLHLDAIECGGHGRTQGEDGRCFSKVVSLNPQSDLQSGCYILP